MAIFQKTDAAETRREYKVTTVSVSLLTYLVAIASIIAVNWVHVKQRCVRWWQLLALHYRSISAAMASPAPTSPESKPEDVGNLTGSTSEAKDPGKSVIDEEVGQAVNRRFTWFALPRDSSRRQAKGKEPDRSPSMMGGKLDV